MVEATPEETAKSVRPVAVVATVARWAAEPLLVTSNAGAAVAMRVMATTGNCRSRRTRWFGVPLWYSV